MTTRKHEIKEGEELQDAQLEHHKNGDCLGPPDCPFCEDELDE